MINILIPAGGKSQFFEDSYFPKAMTEISGETMLEKAINSFQSIDDKRFIFVFNREECVKFHVDESAKILAGEQTEIIVLQGETGGALCSCLLAMDYIDNGDALIISNLDQVIDVNHNEIMNYFLRKGCVGGVITFKNVHPRWSYARISDDVVVEVAEKRPISAHAIAGIYYFANGFRFTSAAEKAIFKKRSTEGKYYISASLNEIILDGGMVGYQEIAGERYHSFYSPEKISEYEQHHGGRI